MSSLFTNFAKIILDSPKKRFSAVGFRNFVSTTGRFRVNIKHGNEYLINRNIEG